MSKNKFYTAIYDAAFKGVFCKRNNRDLLKALLENSLKKKIEIQSLEANEIPKTNLYIRNKTLDAVVKVEKELILIEVNSSVYNGLNRRNAAFIFSKYAEETKVNENYKNMRNIIQINYTAGLPKDYPMVGVYKVVDIDTKKEYIDNITIYEFNVDKIVDACYNGSDKTYAFVALLNTDKDKLSSVCKGDKMMEKFEKEIKDLNSDSGFVWFMTAEEDAKKVHNTLLSNSYEDGEKKGIKERNVEIARNLLSRKMTVKEISEITGLSKKEIESLN